MAATTEEDRVSDWNQQIIDEFRANAGKVGGQFEGAPMLLLHTTGAKSGIERVSPMMYQDLGDGSGGRVRLEGRCTDPPGLVPQPHGEPAGVGRDRRRHDALHGPHRRGR